MSALGPILGLTFLTALFVGEVLYQRRLERRRIEAEIRESIAAAFLPEMTEAIDQLGAAFAELGAAIQPVVDGFMELGKAFTLWYEALPWHLRARLRATAWWYEVRSRHSR